MSDWRLPGHTEVDVLGVGGFGRVVLARHEASGVLVAIKYLHQQFLTDAAVVTGFRREARLLAGVASPHVVRPLDFVESASGAALVMEAVPGVSLRAILAANGALAPESAVAVLKGSLLGLAAAHSVGVVHRDYKPDNVLVSDRGESRLVDFGLAVLDGQRGMSAGSPAYMAPEQWAGHPGTPATDVYAATCVCYQSVTGHRPFEADTSAEFKQLHERAAVRFDAVPEQLRPLLARGMAKQPGHRPPSAAEFVAELDTVAAAAYGPQWEQQGWQWLSGAATALLAVSPAALIVTAAVPGMAVGGAAAGVGTGAGVGAAAAGGAATGVGATAAGGGLLATAAAKTAAAVVTVVALGVGGVLVYQAATDDPPSTEQQAQLRVEMKTMRQPADQRGVVVEARYPQVAGIPQARRQATINELLHRPVTSYPPIPTDVGFRWETNAEVLTPGPDVISVRYDQAAGDFPDYGGVTMVTVDVATARQLGPHEIYTEHALRPDGNAKLAELLQGASQMQACGVAVVNLPPQSFSGHQGEEPAVAVGFARDGVQFAVSMRALGYPPQCGVPTMTLPYDQVGEFFRPDLLRRVRR